MHPSEFEQAAEQWRRVTTRYEKREANYLAMVKIAAIVLLWRSDIAIRP